jgi:hypothetical protein
MKTASKEYKNELINNFQNFQTRFENGLRNTSKTDPKQFWSILNRIDRSSEKEKISIDNLYEYFKDLNNYNDINDESEFDITYDNDFINSSIAGNADDILNSAITEYEIRIAIKDLKNNKASGIGEIINEYLKSTVSQMMPLYVKLFNVVLDSGIIPNAWTIGVIRPIYKKKGSLADLANYRAITIVSNLGKLFTSILNKRLNKYADNIELITKMQASFRKYFYIAFTYFYLLIFW